MPDGSRIDAGTRAVSWAAALQPEDVALVGWVAVVQPVLRGVRLPLAGTYADLTDRQEPLLGIAYAAAVALAIVSLGLREPDRSGRLVLSWTENQFGIVFGPFLGGVLLLASIANANLGVAGPALVIGSVVAAIVVAVASSRLPVAPPVARRLLVQPFVFLAAGVFNATMAEISPGLGFAPLTGVDLATALQGLALTVGLIAVFGSVFYAMLVFAPRQVANPEGTTAGWLVRYALFVAGTVVGSSWLRLLGS